MTRPFRIAITAVLGAAYHRLTATRRGALGVELENRRRFAAGLEAVLRGS